MGYLEKIFKQKRNNKKLKCQKKFYFANICLCVFSIIMLLGYFIQVNTMAYKGYVIRDAEKEIAVLKNEYKQLEIEAISLQSLQSLDRRAVDLDLVAAANSEYLFILGSEVAQR